MDFVVGLVSLAGGGAVKYHFGRVSRGRSGLSPGRVLTRRLARSGHIGEHSEIATDMPHARHLVTVGLQTEEETRLGLWVARRDYERADYSAARQLDEQVLAAKKAKR